MRLWQHPLHNPCCSTFQQMPTTTHTQRCVRLQGEYAGEMITLAEAERRGSVWDALDSSFIFQLNGAWAVDSRKAGHLLKHASPLAAFCLAACCTCAHKQDQSKHQCAAMHTGKDVPSPAVLLRCCMLCAALRSAVPGRVGCARGWCMRSALLEFASRP